MKIIINIPEDEYKAICNNTFDIDGYFRMNLSNAFKNSILLPKEYGRLGDLDELEKRISNFIEHNSKMSDDYTIAIQRFIVDGIHNTLTIIEPYKAESEEI